MSKVLARLESQINDRRNYMGLARNSPHGNRSGEQGVLVSIDDLIELVKEHQGMDARLRASNDYRYGDAVVHNTVSLAHEVNAAFYNLGVEETLDIVMFNITGLRKHQFQVNERNKHELHCRNGGKRAKGLFNINYSGS